MLNKPEMEEVTEEVIDLMDVQLADEIDQMKCLICESGDQGGLQRLLAWLVQQTS